MRTLLCFVLLAASATVLTPVGQAADWKPLFNGKDMTGWEFVGPGRFVVEDGMLKTEGGMGLLYYKGEKLGNATVRVVYKIAEKDANSGVIIRLPEEPKDPWYAVHNGYEVQIDGQGDDWHSTGALYSLAKAQKRMQKAPGEWNTMEIELKGQKTTVVVNGQKVTEFTGTDPVPERQKYYEPVRGPRPDAGYIGLQNHGENQTVFFKEISVKK